MKRLLAALVCAALVALAAFLWLRTAEPRPEDRAPPDVVVHASQAANADAAAVKHDATSLAADTETPAAVARDVAAVPEPVAAPIDPNTPAVLTVVVVAKETGEPLANTQVQVRDPKAPRVDSSKSLPTKKVGPATTATLGEEVLTTDSGRVTFEVPPGVLVDANAWSPTRTTSGEKTPVKALAPGEHREVRFELLTREDGVCCGLVIDAETKAPIANATLKRGPFDLKPGELLHTETDGRFRFTFASWNSFELEVTAPGYALQTFSPDDSAPTPERALVIELARSASLVVHLRGYVAADGARAMITATVPRYVLRHPSQTLNTKFVGDSDRRWSAEFDATWSAELNDLPCGAKIALVARSAKRELYRAAEPIVLTPRERREFVCDYDPGCTLTVETLDADGKPLPFVSLWLLEDEGRDDYLGPSDERSAVQRGKADEQGVTVFEAVAARAWRIGPAARYAKRDELDPNALAPVATRFTLAPGAREHTLELRLERALYIRGRVLEPDGRPCAKASVRAHGERGYVPSSAIVKEDGTFVVGPLASGMHKLRAGAFGQLSESVEVEAAAGALDVELSLKPGVRVRGNVVDATSGAACAAHISCAELAGGGSWHMTDTKPDGAFDFNGLTPGRYAVIATARDGRIGIVRDLERVAGVNTPDVRVAVAPGARLKTRFDATEGQLIVEIEQDGARFAQDAVLPGATSQFSVPPGLVTVRSKLSKTADWRVEHVTLAAGEERELAIR